jgi:hypothetical protein
MKRFANATTLIVALCCVVALLWTLGGDFSTVCAVFMGTALARLACPPIFEKTLAGRQLVIAKRIVLPILDGALIGTGPQTLFLLAYSVGSRAAVPANDSYVVRAVLFFDHSVAWIHYYIEPVAHPSRLGGIFFVVVVLWLALLLKRPVLIGWAGRAEQFVSKISYATAVLMAFSLSTVHPVSNSNASIRYRLTTEFHKDLEGATTLALAQEVAALAKPDVAGSRKPEELLLLIPAKALLSAHTPQQQAEIIKSEAHNRVKTILSGTGMPDIEPETSATGEQQRDPEKALIDLRKETLSIRQQADAWRATTADILARSIPDVVVGGPLAKMFIDEIISNLGEQISDRIAEKLSFDRIVELSHDFKHKIARLEKPLIDYVAHKLVTPDAARATVARLESDRKVDEKKAANAGASAEPPKAHAGGIDALVAHALLNPATLNEMESRDPIVDPDGKPRINPKAGVEEAAKKGGE